MIKSVPFLTRARTVDHLGREQIADCPTAISELWKNAYDAYARSVELHIFGGPNPVAAIYDDGHGMTYQEFLDRWLVVGTDTKFQERDPNSADSRAEALDAVCAPDGEEPLTFRPKQGQKGIGRLSSANLAPLLLLVSKTKDAPFVAALIDWRLFENPYLILSDIEIPVTEFDNKEDLLEQLPQLFEKLVENVWGGSLVGDRKNRIERAWSAYDSLSGTGDALTPSERIAQTIIGSAFELRHLVEWDVWEGRRPHGTAMLMAELNFDLIAQLPTTPKDATVQATRDNFVNTLSSFVDPLYDPAVPEVNAIDPQFRYAVKTWVDNVPEILVSSDKEFDRRSLDVMEHILDGTLDEGGTFRGQIKAFGKWQKVGKEYVVPPPSDVNIPNGPNTRVGPVDVYIASYEQERKNSSHTDAEYSLFGEWGDRYSGLKVYRNSLRVLPYGRVDNDFFQIEMRRSKNAGREFWNARRMFGRIALSRANNPNLKDKAGREGFIDNAAAKTLRLLLTNVLQRSARDYFGSASSLRKPTLAELNRKHLEEKAKVERDKLRKAQLREFKDKLRLFNKDLPGTVQKVRTDVQTLQISTKGDIIAAQSRLEMFRNALSQFRLPEPPSDLGTLEREYRDFRSQVVEFQTLLSALAEQISKAVDDLQPSADELIEKQYERASSQLGGRLRTWTARIAELRDQQGSRFTELLAERFEAFRSMAEPIVRHVKSGDVSLNVASKSLEECRAGIESESEEIFETYIRALQSLKESIDLEVIASYGVRENDELRLELDRLNGLAQLGIAVEIVAHELQSYDDAISSGLRRLPKELHGSRAVEEIRLGYEGLSKQLSFLSPLKLSGQRTQRYIFGTEIFEYMQQFFDDQLHRDSVELQASPEFLTLKLFEQPARIFPVFINIINNAIYWVGTTKKSEKKVLLSVVDGHVVISDNGPGVDEIDVPNLFSLFFTRKLRGGRGVGLYLSRVNLAAGGHRIEYGIDKSGMPLDGANFIIDFKGAEYGGS
jgi:signal transduction histidine kinase